MIKELGNEYTEKEIEEDSIALKRIANELGVLLEKKNHDYSSASFFLGLQGVWVHLFDKMKRIENQIVKKEEYKVDEKLIDSLRDLAGYALIGVRICEKEKSKCVIIPEDIEMIMVK